MTTGNDALDSMLALVVVGFILGVCRVLWARWTVDKKDVHDGE